MRVLVVTNFEPDDQTPQRGRWVRDQVDALRSLGIEVELFSFPPGRQEYGKATRRIRKILRQGEFDLVHAHYGLVGWCALLAGADPLVVTFHGTDVRHPVVGRLSRALARRVDLSAPASASLLDPEDGRPGLPRLPGHQAVLPCGADLSRFMPVDRSAARRELDLDPGARLIFFPADPTRPEKAVDRARALADEVGAELLTGGDIEPDRMPIWMNAADLVVITSLYEGFGLAAIEALACGVPVASTPVGIAPAVLGASPSTLCREFDLGDWSRFAGPIIDRGGVRIPAGPTIAAPFSSEHLARRVAIAYIDVLARSGPASDRDLRKDGVVE